MSSKDKTATRPKLLWFHLLFVVPCIILFYAGFSSGGAGYFVIAMFLLPVALVTLFLDVYYFISDRKK